MHSLGSGRRMWAGRSWFGRRWGRFANRLCVGSAGRRFMGWTFHGGVAVPEPLQQHSPATGDARLDRADRDGERLRDLGVVEVTDVAHDDRNSELLWQLGERGVDGESVDDALDSA